MYGIVSTVVRHISEHRKVSTCQEIERPSIASSVYASNTHTTHTRRPAHTPLALPVATIVCLRSLNLYLSQYKRQRGEVHLDKGIVILSA